MSAATTFLALKHPAAGKAGIASLCAVEHRCPGLPEPGRYADET
jgi:hypothetical protein